MHSVTIRLIAEAFDELDGDVVYSLGLAEKRDDEEEGFALVLSAAEPDREDDGYSVTAEPGQRTAYRAIASSELHESLLRVRLTEDGVARLDLPAEFSLQLAVDSDQLATLGRGLVRLGVPFERPV